MMTDATLKFSGKNDDLLSNNDGLAAQQIRRVCFNQDDLSVLIDVEDGTIYPVTPGKSNVFGL